MEAQNPFEAVRTMMLDNLEKMGGATQRYLDMVEMTMRGFPGANQEQIGVFKAYIERQVAANRDFVEKLLHAHDFQEVFRIQVEYFSCRHRGCERAPRESPAIVVARVLSMHRTKRVMRWQAP